MPQTRNAQGRRVPTASTPCSSEMTSQNLEPVCDASNAQCSRQKSSHRINSVLIRSVVEGFRRSFFFSFVLNRFRKHLKEFLLQTKMMCAITERQASEEKEKQERFFFCHHFYFKKIKFKKVHISYKKSKVIIFFSSREKQNKIKETQKCFFVALRFSIPHRRLPRRRRRRIRRRPLRSPSRARRDPHGPRRTHPPPYPRRRTSERTRAWST